MEHNDEWADMREWLEQLGGPRPADLPDAVACPLFEKVGFEQIADRLGPERTWLFLERAKLEARKQLQHLEALARYGAIKFDSPVIAAAGEAARQMRADLDAIEE